MPHPVEAFITETGDDFAAFAARIGASPEALRAVIDGASPDLALARRIVAACGGAVELKDLLPEGAAVEDFTGRRDDAPDAELLAGVIELAAEALMNGVEAYDLDAPAPRRGNSAPGPALARIGAEVAIATYAVLGPSADGRLDRLAQALRPALSEILAECGAVVPAVRLDQEAARSARLYFEAARRRR